MNGHSTSGLIPSVQALALLLATAGTLRALDWWPRSMTQAGQVREAQTIESVELAAGRRLALPAWFPRSLPWPPSRVHVQGVTPRAVALEFGSLDGGAPQLVLASSVREQVELPADFFPAALLMESRSIPWRGGQAQLSRFWGEDGAAWVELTWEQDGQNFAYRTRGSLEQLLSLAASVHREGP